MWSGPRNLSTALMRAWENRPDAMVLDEPLYAHYLATTGLDHPGRDEIMANGPVGADAAVGRCLEPLPDGITISYQKHMTHHLLASIDRSWLDQVRNFLLIRDPVAVLASYTQVRSEVTLDDLGLPQQIELASRAELVIDAADFLTDPRAYLTTWCDHLGLELTERMLSWPAGRRASDGCWAPHWYGAVEASTGFGPAPDPLAAATVDDLPSPLRPLARDATELYHQLRVGRLRL
ncbi:MAG: HAD family hydrolase [Actinomycetia bacterium]|nr:HAD family hydrolase [Actinomycetes bacterium]MCP4227787.1 HAD family hydrolase [Actinomycetes bacterium]MCP5030448.1 HAD family hydrolase [Actinomycetes bacterium]